MPPSYKTIRYERHGDIGSLTLARPGKRNAQNPLMWEELARLGAELLGDEPLRCLLVTGDGPSFSTDDQLYASAGYVGRRPSPRMQPSRPRAV